MQPQRLPSNKAYAFAKLNGLSEQVSAIRRTEIVKWDRPYKTSVRKGQIIEILQRANLFERFLDEAWPDGRLPESQKSIAFYLQLKDDYNGFLGRNEESAEAEFETEEESLTFALENHLRDFLAKNLDKIEKGLTLFSIGDRVGIEFPVDGGRIDILAIDKQGNPVVIELKLSQGRNRVLGQILYYMSWVDRNLNRGQSRGIIIANDIDPELRAAVSRAPGVELATYKMQFSIEKVGYA